LKSRQVLSIKEMSYTLRIPPKLCFNYPNWVYSRQIKEFHLGQHFHILSYSKKNGYCESFHQLPAIPRNWSDCRQTFGHPYNTLLFKGFKDI